MTLATLRGRLHTKILTFLIVGPTAVVVAILEDCTVFYTMFFLMVGVGLLLEVLWGSFITHEPGWLTIVFAIIEFTIVFSIVKIFYLDIRFSLTAATFIEGIRFYLIAWGLTQLFLIYILPVLRTSWMEDGGELL